MDTILVIDDEAFMRAFLRGTLEGANYQVVVADNGVSGLAACRLERPRLVVTDLMMPEKDGLETIRELRKFAPEIKIIAISGGGLFAVSESAARGTGVRSE